jgi:molybdopterin-guanine dinucleotide biosynthesis protein A
MTIQTNFQTNLSILQTPYDALILAGGKGTRMGNQDKGWVLWQGKPFIQHMLGILKTQQPAPLNIYISANRNPDQYSQLGCQVIADDRASFQGPLAGIEQALLHLKHQAESNSMTSINNLSRNSHMGKTNQSQLIAASLDTLLGLIPSDVTLGVSPCTTPLLVVPCDTPLLPKYLFSLLYEGLDETTDATYATSPNGAHPLCCLVKPNVLGQLTAQLNNNERRVMSWLTLINAKPVHFESDAYFKNFNDVESLQVTH